MIKNISLNKKIYTFIFILILILIAGFFRFYNLNWDQGNYFHPDERNIANAVSQISFFSQLNPHFFAYGGFTIYLYRLTGDLLVFITKDISWVSNWGNIDVIGRFFSALFSTLTIIPLYLLAKKVSDKKTALLTVVLYAFTVGSIQVAHYAVTESLITLIGISICFLSIIILKKMKTLNTLVLGIICGIGIAAKTSAIVFLLMPFLAYILAKRTQKIEFKKIIIHFISFLLITFVVFTIFSPYTFLDWNKFMESMRYESGVAIGSLPVVYTLQFDHTIPYLFQIKNFFWQIGIDTIFCILGFIFVLFETIRRRNKELLIFSIFPLLYFLYIGSWHTKFIRYMVPIIPFLLIASSIFLIKIRSKLKVLGNLLIGITIFTTIIWALAFFSIYTRIQTRIAASEWVYLNIPNNAKILNEQWDDGLPIPLRQFSPAQYQITSLAMYDTDNLNKINYLSYNLSSSDYIIFNSRRLYGTLIHLTDKYPITSQYYKLLFEGKLGYKEVAQFTSYPSMFGFEINDDTSEETFQVYEHPKVIIFKNEERMTINQYATILKNAE
jgi:4-amino-4-deoxy-L-arabinose transferase-like glycosyltransferase